MNRDLVAWLAMLAKLAHPLDPAGAAKALAPMAEKLAKEFPPAAFTTASLEAVARAVKRLPTYGELCDALSAWWRENRGPGSDALALDMPEAERSLNAYERAWVRRWRSHEANGFANLDKELIVPPYRHLPADPRTQLRAHIASLIRSVAPKAWGVISGRG